jgi:uncharacterized repeat protein (TIGR02543 family)
MKLRNLSTAIALAAVIVFTACSSGGGGGGGGRRGPGGQTATTYTVTFDINGGSGTTPGERTVNAGSRITLPDGSGFSQSGCIFDGWNTEAGGTGTNYSAGTSLAVTGDITLYAKWIEVPAGSFAVIFNSNGGSSVAIQIISSGDTAARPANPTRSGYTFDDWYSDSSLTTVYNFSTPVTGTITLYAKWTRTTAAVTQYTVTFNINSGTGTAPEAQTITAGASLTLPAGGGISRSGYTFGGWNTEASGTGTNYSAGASYTPTGDITLYAKWLANTAGITLVVGQIIDETEAQTIPAITISRTGNGGYPVTRLVSVENPSQYSSISWEIAGVGVYAGLTGNGTEANPFPLAANIWINSSITSNTSGGALWYSFGVTSGTTYYVWGNDGVFGDGTKTLIAKWSAYYSSGASIFTDGLNLWSSPKSFTANTNGTVKVKVEPYSSSSYSNTGTLAVAYSASSTRPDTSGSTNSDSSGSSFTLDAGDVRYNSTGGHVLKLTVTKNGQQYQRAIPFTIVP